MSSDLPSIIRDRLSYYGRCISEQIPDKAASILVVAGAGPDRDTFMESGFTNVTISNIDTRTQAARFAPYEWSLQDAENLTFADQSFDYVVVHAALHHCRSPHRALLEMYRVARIGVMFFESRDSLLMKHLVRLGMTTEFEYAAVFYNDCRLGGVANTHIPNYIYRWTEREVVKTINSFAPHGEHTFTFGYESTPPAGMELVKGSRLRQLVIRIAQPAYSLFVRIFPRQQNLFSVYIGKPQLPGALRPWLRLVGDVIEFNSEWVAGRLHKGRNQ
jgi:SAM-dependent methyltransferase